jgi:hypothetical protein
MPQAATMASSQFDVEMQRHIESLVSPRVPALCIRNLAGDSGDLPAFIVADEEWEPLARTLVHNAGLIVVYFLSLTAGVTEELELIRHEQKQKATLVVIEEDDPFEDKVGLSSLLELRRNEPPTVQVPIADTSGYARGTASRVPAARSAEEFLYRSSDKGIRCRDEADQGETVRGSRGRSDSIPRLRTLRGAINLFAGE